MTDNCTFQLWSQGQSASTMTAYTNDVKACVFCINWHLSSICTFENEVTIVYFSIEVVCLCSCLYNMYFSGHYRGQNRILDPLKLDLQMIGCCNVQGKGTGSSQRVVNIFNLGAITSGIPFLHIKIFSPTLSLISKIWLVNHMKTPEDSVKIYWDSENKNNKIH